MFRELAGRLLSGARSVVERLMTPSKESRSRSKGTKKKAKARERREPVGAGSPATRPSGVTSEATEGADLSLEESARDATRERRGSERDTRSFEQARRGGPVTGEAPPKAHGPRHTGGGHRRGRAPDEDTEEAAYPDLPVIDYDVLAPTQIEERIQQLSLVEIRRLRAYEAANKARKGVLDVLERRLAA